MRYLRAPGLAAGFLLCVTAASAPGCGSGEDLSFTTTTGSAQGATTGSSDPGSTGSGGSGSGASAEGAGTGGSASGTGGAGTGGSEAVADPDKDGPYSYAELDDSIKVPATGNQVPIHCVYPTAGPDAGPYPVVVVAHGLQIPASQYYSYLKRLASFGYVALTADFPANPFGGEIDNVKNANDLSAALDWVAEQSKTPGSKLLGDVNLAGTTGHSLGGKLALLAATMDPRVKASITLDPVDGGGGPGGCSEPQCVDVSDKMPALKIPTGLLGQKNSQTCAPAADNYTTFYAKANPPSLEVTVTKANHVSFIDTPASCGSCFLCGGVNDSANAAVNALSRAYVVAFYERHLRGNASYDAYLTGAEAKARYVDTGLVTIQSK